MQTQARKICPIWPDDIHRFFSGNKDSIPRILLGNDVLVIEHLGPNLARVAGKRLIIGAFPIKIVGADEAPFPIFALLE